eukprot:GSChrysophyteH2.ASY1.ANO1.998.1 assembled CDS
MIAVLSLWVLLVSLVKQNFVSYGGPSSGSVQQVEPYMDEIFHIPQAQRFCEYSHISQHNWDPKITTFPGVYVISVALEGIGAFVPCSTSHLRCHNVVLSVALLLVCSLLRTHERDVAITGLTCMLWPGSFLYYFLYYTDTASSLLLLLVGSGSGSGSNVRSAVALCGCASLAILARQTNAAWVLFCAGVHVLRRLRSFGSYTDGGRGVNGDLAVFPRALWAHINRLLWEPSACNGSLQLWALLLPVLAFIVYVVRFNNGSIVVGDVSAHKPVLHWAMFFHAAALVCSKKEKKEGKEGKGWPVAVTLLLHAAGVLLCSASLLNGSHPHPYLLADNRHYTFYLWNRFLAYPFCRAALGVAYYLLYFIVFRWWKGQFRTFSRTSKMWILGFVATACATLVPTPLLEPRYFTPVVHVQVKVSVPGAAYVPLFAFAVLNAMVLAVFLLRPFQWPDGSTARFMW